MNAIGWLCFLGVIDRNTAIQASSFYQLANMNIDSTNGTLINGSDIIKSTREFVNKFDYRQSRLMR